MVVDGTVQQHMDSANQYVGHDEKFNRVECFAEYDKLPLQYLNIGLKQRIALFREQIDMKRLNLPKYVQHYFTGEPEQKRSQLIEMQRDLSQLSGLVEAADKLKDPMMRAEASGALEKHLSMSGSLQSTGKMSKMSRGQSHKMPPPMMNGMGKS